jgi:CheY-like chemotaxis protein
MNTPSVSSHYVLVIDDDEAIRELLKDFLERTFPRYKVIEAVDGTDGIRKMINQKFRAVICDLKMPKATGMDVIKALTADARVNKPDAILVLSGLLSDDQIKSMNASGKTMAHFFSKPLNEADVTEYLKNILV